MAQFIKVKPTELLHGVIRLSKKVFINPNSDWRELPITAEKPKDEKKLAEWQLMMDKVNHYWTVGKLQVKGKIPQRKRVKETFYCKEKDGHLNSPVPVFKDGLCSFHYNKKHPEIFAG